MSTILKALKKLEHDKQVEAATSRAHDPLAPAMAPSATPDAKTENGGRMGLVFTAAALTFVVGVGIGVFTLAPESSLTASPTASPTANSPPTLTATPPVAAANGGQGSSRDSRVLGAAASPTARRGSPIAGVEPVGAPAFSSGAVSRGPILVAASGAPSASARPVGAGVDSVEGARGPAPEPDPWEAAALAAETAAAEEEFANEKTAEDRAQKVEPARAVVPPVAAGPRATEASAAAKRTATVPSDAIPVASLPLEEISTDTSTEVEPARTDAPSSASVAAVADLTSDAVDPAPIAESARPGIGDVSVNDAEDRFEVKVLKTVWHPRPERRSASLELSAGGEVIEVGEGDPVSDYLVEEITPSKVVLSKDGVTVSHRVGH